MLMLKKLYIVHLPEEKSSVKCHVVHMQQLGPVWIHNVAKQPVEHWKLADRIVW